MKKVCLVGASPFQDDSFLRERKEEGCYLISCDGGYQHFLNQHIEPDLFVGDFDTFDEKKLIKPKKVIHLSVVKDDTDTLFAVKTCLREGYDTFYLYGCLGGKIDHTIANLQLLSFLRERNARGYLFDLERNQMVLLLQNEKVTFEKNSKGMLSVFAVDGISHDVTEKNLKFTLSHQDLSSSFPLGISNEFLNGKQGYLSVRNGKLLLVCPIGSLQI